MNSAITPTMNNTSITFNNGKLGVGRSGVPAALHQRCDDEMNALNDWHHVRIQPLIDRIKAQPITSLSALVDRAVVAAYDCQGSPNSQEWFANDNSKAVAELISAVLGARRASSHAQQW